MKKLLSTCMLFYLACVMLQTQKITLFKGPLMDSLNKPLADISLNESSKNGTITDKNGKLSLRIKSNSAVSHVGYAPQKIKYYRKKITAPLITDSKSAMEKIVVDKCL